MLRVEGVEAGGREKGTGERDGERDGEGEMEGEALEVLRERWERGMEELRRVVGRE